MSATCLNCSYSARNRVWGGYSFQCAQCCARLLWSARADQNLWNANMEAIRRFSGKPERKEIAAAYKALEASNGKPSTTAPSRPATSSPAPSQAQGALI